MKDVIIMATLKLGAGHGDIIKVPNILSVNYDRDSDKYVPFAIIDGSPRQGTDVLQRSCINYWKFYGVQKERAVCANSTGFIRELLFGKFSSAMNHVQLLWKAMKEFYGDSMEMFKESHYLIRKCVIFQDEELFCKSFLKPYIPCTGITTAPKHHELPNVLHIYGYFGQEQLSPIYYQLPNNLIPYY